MAMPLATYYSSTRRGVVTGAIVGIAAAAPDGWPVAREQTGVTLQQPQRFEPSILVSPFLQGCKHFFGVCRLLQCRCLRVMAILDHGQVPSQLFEQTDELRGFLLS